MSNSKTSKTTVSVDSQVVVNASDVIAESSAAINPMSDLIADIESIKSDVYDFLSMPCYDLLLSVSANLTDSLFIVNKENTNPLRGTFSLFQASDYQGQSLQDLTIPSVDFDALISLKFAVVIDDLRVSEYNKYLKEITDDSVVSQLVKDIDNLKTAFVSDSLRVRYANYQRVKAFLSSKSADDFIVDIELDLYELDDNLRRDLLAVYQAAFKANPSLVTMGASIPLVKCNLDSIAGIDQCLEQQKQHSNSRFAFLTQTELLKCIKIARKASVSDATLYRLIARLDSTIGSKQNSGSAMAAIKMLHGTKPVKGRTKSA